MANATEVKQAQAILDRLVELDAQTVEAYYDMGSLLASIQHGELFKILGYESMTHLIEEELTYSPATAFKYSGVYRRFRQLHYTKVEAVKLLQKHGISPVSRVLMKLKDKVGNRAFAKRVADLDVHVIGFMLNGEQFARARQILIQHGAIEKNQRLDHSSEAFLEILNKVAGKAKPKLTAVK